MLDGEVAHAARLLNQPFRKHARTGRPLVVLKMAMTLDGKVATRTGDWHSTYTPSSLTLRVTALTNRVVPRWSFHVSRAGMLMSLRSAVRLLVAGRRAGLSVQMCLFTGPPGCPVARV